jgi:hypothetical protein
MLLNKKIEEQQLLFLLLGMLIALLLSFGTPLFPFSVLFLAGVAMVLCFTVILAKKRYYMRLRLIFLGASIASVISAFITFFLLARTGLIGITLDALVGVFRSILLASFFSLLERLTKYFEEQMETQQK